MKTLLCALLLLSTLAFAQDDDLSETMMPRKFRPRKAAVLNVGLVYYGDYYKVSDLARVQKLFEARFAAATGNALKLNTVASGIFPFKTLLTSVPDFKLDYVTAPDRLQRLWYYYSKNMGVVNEIYQVVKEDAAFAPKLAKMDALVVITGAQFEALGFASGRIAITENPMEIAWGLKDGGSVEYVTDERVVDELIHETGHVLGLDHASSQCHQEGMDYAAMQACCETSDSKNDVMSYCRSRNNVKGNFFYGFEACHRRNLSKVAETMLDGGTWMGEKFEDCR